MLRRLTAAGSASALWPFDLAQGKQQGVLFARRSMAGPPRQWPDVEAGRGLQRPGVPR